jgi:hypothetical protein
VGASVRRRSRTENDPPLVGAEPTQSSQPSRRPDYRELGPPVRVGPLLAEIQERLPSACLRLEHPDDVASSAFQVSVQPSEEHEMDRLVDILDSD